MRDIRLKTLAIALSCYGTAFGGTSARAEPSQAPRPPPSAPEFLSEDYYRALAHKGDAFAQVSLACDLYVKNTPDATAEARHWLEAAAAQGDARATVYLAKFILRGIGGPTDEHRALDLLRLVHAALVTGRYHRISPRTTDNIILEASAVAAANDDPSREYAWWLWNRKCGDTESPWARQSGLFIEPKAAH